jgi:hypothetical protein
MANFKRRKSRRIVRCTLCTPYRWQGNGKGRFKTRDVVSRAIAQADVLTPQSSSKVQIAVNAGF